MYIYFHCFLSSSSTNVILVWFERNTRPRVCTEITRSCARARAPLSPPLRTSRVVLSFSLILHLFLLQIHIHIQLSHAYVYVCMYKAPTFLPTYPVQAIFIGHFDFLVSYSLVSILSNSIQSSISILYIAVYIHICA